MKQRLFIFTLSLCFSVPLMAQVRITTVYSPNGEYYIKTIPYDYNDVQPSLYGKSVIYNKKAEILYTIRRGFNNVRNAGNFLSISNDGKTVIYAITRNADENVEGLKSVSIYKDAKLVKSLSLQQITGCDKTNERCILNYYNYDQVVDTRKSDDYNPNSIKVFKEGVSDEEKFLSDYAIFSTDKELYITDPKKTTHIIDLKGSKIAHVNFADAYPGLKKIAGKGVRSFYYVATPAPGTANRFPNLRDGRLTGVELGNKIVMQPIPDKDVDLNKYRYYVLVIEAFLNKNGTLEVINIDNHNNGLPLDKIRSFFEQNLFDSSFLPPEMDGWHFNYSSWWFRNPSPEVAMQEKIDLDKQRLAERERRMTLDSIDHVYIPRNMEECLTELDKMIPAVAKKEMLALKSRNDMDTYFFSGGMGIRNQWGLHGGSRLLVYFRDRGLFHERMGDISAEAVSAMILECYYDWLQGNKNAAKEFEAKYPVKTK